MAGDKVKSENQTAYCVPMGQDFQKFYINVHGYIALVICLLGSLANSVNIAVLSRREMTSPTNSILTALAVADLLVMLDYIPFAFHIYVTIFPTINRNTYRWAVFVYFHSIFSQIFHTISIWLTITLAVWRYIAVKLPQRNRTLCNMKNTRVVIVLAYIICPIFCIPIYFAMYIRRIDDFQHAKFNRTLNSTRDYNASDNEPMYALNMTTDHELLTAIFWIYSVFIKLIPCIVLTFIIASLILKLRSSDRKRQKLLKKPPREGEKYVRGGARGRTDRTTRMLLALLGLFLATELPQALFGLLTASAPLLFQICYYSFGEVMDLMALVGSAVNFVLYCSMSQQFRMTFTRLAAQVLPFMFRQRDQSDTRQRGQPTETSAALL